MLARGEDLLYFGGKYPPMRAITLKTVVFSMILGCSVHAAKAQHDPSLVKQQALKFADSLINAFRYNNFDEYINISYPGVIKYYGGKHQFKEYITRARTIVSDAGVENIELLQLENNDREWQCVIKKTRAATIDNKPATVVSYLVGQSKDDGLNWKYFDVAFNSVQNIIYIMPDVFDNLAIPQRQIVFAKN